MKEKFVNKIGKRRRLIEAQLGRCAYCGEELKNIPFEQRKPSDWVSAITTDHVIPKVRGGSDDIENLVAVHQRCNIIKGELMPQEIVKLFENMVITFKSKGLL